MSIRHTILGFLSWKPFTGYELKKFFIDSLAFYWSGNNNQIYGSLLQLHKDGAVELSVQTQEAHPPRKVYRITPKGREELLAWLRSEPELPQIRTVFHLRLAWADSLAPEELDRLLGDYEAVLEAQCLMCREQARRGTEQPARSARESLIWKRIEEGQLEAYERELDWARRLRAELRELEGGAGKE